jgi:hypothetical protein
MYCILSTELRPCRTREHKKERTTFTQKRHAGTNIRYNETLEGDASKANNHVIPQLNQAAARPSGCQNASIQWNMGTCLFPVASIVACLPEREHGLI